MKIEKTFFKARIEKVREGMEEEKTDMLVLVPSSYMKYMTGYSGRPDERFFAWVLLRTGKTAVIGNALYKEQIESMPADQSFYWEDGDNPYLLVENILAKEKISVKKIAIDPNMPTSFFIRLKEVLPEGFIINGDCLIDPLRIYKDQGEQEIMEQACRKADQALKRTIGLGKQWIGKTEEEFLAKLVYEMTCLGIQNGAACVCVGENAAEPHHCPGENRIEKGKSLLVDFGGAYKNYNTDMTRNFYFGVPDLEYMQVYQIVEKALELGKKAAEIGNRLEDVDDAVRKYITEKGYGEFFTHRTGHGIGLDCHEGPSVQAGEKTKIAVGMTFSIEPGIYIPGKFGIRIEDQIMITEKGARALHRYPLDLSVIPC